MEKQKSEFESQFVPPQERIMSSKDRSKVRFKGGSGSYSDSNKLSLEMGVIETERMLGEATTTEDSKFAQTRRNRHAPIQTKYRSSTEPFVGVTVAMASYKPFDRDIVMDSRKHRFATDILDKVPTPVDLENDNKQTCTSASYVNHGQIPKTKPVVPVKFKGDDRVFTLSKRTQYRDAYNDHQSVELYRSKPKAYKPTKAKFRDSTTNRVCYQHRLAEARLINNPLHMAKGPDAKYNETTHTPLPFTGSTTYTNNFTEHAVQPRSQEKRVIPTEPLVQLKFNAKSNSQMSYVAHQPEFYLF